jgi:dUTP pyrophosphatase
MELKYSIDEGYVTTEPIRGTEHSAGLDVYVPELTTVFQNQYNELNKKIGRYLSHPISAISAMYPNPEVRSISISPHGRVVIPTGLRFEIPQGTYLEVANRGSVASKLGLVYGAHIIDEDYRGIVFISLINTTSEDITIEPGIKLVQLIHKEYIKSKLVRVPAVSLDTERSEGALGSTGQ